LVNGAGHGRILRSVANLLFGPKTKQRTIWLTGVANSGKSQFIRRIR
jgi:adenylylsulfate kinase-like enzyme